MPLAPTGDSRLRGLAPKSARPDNGRAMSIAGLSTRRISSAVCFLHSRQWLPGVDVRIKLWGGDKGSQATDISWANELWSEWKGRQS